jgi:hypothetical protein
MSRTVVVLGAGATRGARFRTRTDKAGTWSRHPGAPRPALDADFFDRLLHVADGNPDHYDLARDVAACAREVSTTSGFPTLEQVFTFMEAAQRMGGKGLTIRGLPPEQRMSQLRRAIALQLGSCLWSPNAGPGNNPHYQCEHHHWLVDQLDLGDTIISFNYDCLIDWSLKSRAGAAKWNPKTGYGWQFGNLKNADVWTTGDKETNPSASIRLLKLHGSLNWKMEGESISLSTTPYATGEEHSIIPPVWDKRTKDWPFEVVWDTAKEAIRHAHAIVFIGYSMPTTDVSAQVLFRSARQGVPLVESMCIVNPDAGAGNRVTAVLSEARSAQTRIPRAESWEEFRELDALSGTVRTPYAVVVSKECRTGGYALG